MRSAIETTHSPRSIASWSRIAEARIDAMAGSRRHGLISVNGGLC
jgi:hypothetical protein